MKITKNQLRRIIREESARLQENKLLGGFGFGPSVQEEVETTVKYNANPALKGGQTKLPDHLQKSIIDAAKKKGKLKEADLAKSEEYYDAILKSLFAVNMGGPVPPEEIAYAIQALRELADELEGEL